jgi:hypothetical protein
MEYAAKVLIMIGIVAIVAGGLLYLGARSGILSQLPLGRLPGDIRVQSGNFTCFFPLATMILLSVILTVVLNVVVRILRK